MVEEKKPAKKQAEEKTEKPVEEAPVQPSEEQSIESTEKPVEPEQQNEESKEKPEPTTEEVPIEEPPKPEEQIKPQEEKTEEPAAPKEEIKPVKTKPKAEEKPTKDNKEKTEEADDFQYIIRVANTDIDGNKTVEQGLTQIKGIGRRLSTIIADKAGVNRSLKVGDLSEKQIESLKKALEEINDMVPAWMINHRKEWITGKNIHLVGSDIEMRLRDDVNLLKMIRSYRGIRHESGLAVRGQRTRANNRHGLAMGVSKKRTG